MRPSASEMGQNLHANMEGFAKLVIIKMVIPHTMFTLPGFKILKYQLVFHNYIHVCIYVCVHLVNA